MSHPQLSSRNAAPPRPDAGRHVVLVDEELPYPPVTGKRIRTYNLVRRAAAHHRLTYVCHRNADPAEAREAEAHFAEIGIITRVIDRPVPPRRGARFYARLAANLLSPLPYSVTSHTSREMRAALREIAAAERVDLWHCEWTPYAQAVRDLPGRRVVMAHNVESVIWRRYAEAEGNLLKRWYIKQQYRKFLDFERRELARSDLTIAVSDLDAERFRQELGVPRVDVVDNGVDTAYFAPQQGKEREAATMVFLGSLEWRPNLDGVAQLLDHVFPAVLAQVPEARLLLVGRNPPEWLRRAGGRPGVEVHADVPDVRPFLARAGLMVVPLRIGGGSRLKILEALATGTPVVSTRVGAEGLHLDGHRHLHLTEGIAELPSAILDVIRSPHEARERAAAGRRQVLRLYDWGSLAERLVFLWDRVAGAPPAAATGKGGA